MAFQRITGKHRQTIQNLVDRAWAAGLKEATFSQVSKDEAGWEERIRAAEAAKAKAKAKLEAEEAAKAEAETQAEPMAIIAALRAAGYTIRQIAAAVCVHTSTVYRWASGTFRPQPTRFAALAALAA